MSEWYKGVDSSSSHCRWEITAEGAVRFWDGSDEDGEESFSSVDKVRSEGTRCDPPAIVDGRLDVAGMTEDEDEMTADELRQRIKRLEEREQTTAAENTRLQVELTTLRSKVAAAAERGADGPRDVRPTACESEWYSHSGNNFAYEITPSGRVIFRGFDFVYDPSDSLPEDIRSYYKPCPRPKLNKDGTVMLVNNRRVDAEPEVASLESKLAVITAERDQARAEIEAWRSAVRHYAGCIEASVSIANRGGAIVKAIRDAHQKGRAEAMNERAAETLSCRTEEEWYCRVSLVNENARWRIKNGKVTVHSDYSSHESMYSIQELRYDGVRCSAPLLNDDGTIRILVAEDSSGDGLLATHSFTLADLNVASEQELVAEHQFCIGANQHATWMSNTPACNVSADLRRALAKFATDYKG